MAPASLPTIITPALLSSMRKHPQLPLHSWYFIAATTLTVLNRPDQIQDVYKHALEFGAGHADSQPDHDEKLKISRRMREALVKSSAVGGMPRSINAIMSLKAVTPPELIDEPLGPSPTTRPSDIYEASPASILQRGQDFFNIIYGKIAKRIMNALDESGTEDLGLMARLTYSYVLSDTSVLSTPETSFVLIAGLIPQDLKGHLKGAVNGGATVEEVRAVREIVLQICHASGMRMLGENDVGGWGWRDEVATV